MKSVLLYGESKYKATLHEWRKTICLWINKTGNVRIT